MSVFRVYTDLCVLVKDIHGKFLSGTPQHVSTRFCVHTCSIRAWYKTIQNDKRYVKLIWVWLMKKNLIRLWKGQLYRFHFADQL